MIKAVAFDYGGVLTEGGKISSIPRWISKSFKIPLDEVNVKDIQVDLLRGKIEPQTFIDEVIKRHNVPFENVPGDDVWAEGGIYEKSIPVYELVDELKEKGIKVAVFSNIFGPSAKLLKDGGLYDGFDELVLSCYEGVTKPEKEFYELLINRLGCKPEEILFVDDRTKNSPPAIELGMNFLLAQSPQQIVDDIRGEIAKELYN